MTERIVKRTGSVEQRAKAAKALATAGALRSEYNTAKVKVDGLEQVYETEKERQIKASIALEQAIQILAEAQEEIDADYLPEGAQPVARIQKRDKLQFQVNQLNVALQAQKAITKKAFDAVAIAERKLFDTDKNLNQFVDSIDDADVAVATQAEIDKIRSERLAKLEEKRAKTWENEQKIAIQARAEQVKELRSIAEKQVTATKQLNKKAVDKTIASTTYLGQTANTIKNIRDAHEAERTEVALQLKTSLDAVKVELVSSAAKYQKKVAAAQKELEDEKDSYLAKGLNPYVEFRRRDLDAEAAARELKMKNAVEENKAALAERLIKEEEDRRREAAVERKLKEYEKKHRDEQGRHVIEHKNQGYLKEITAGGMEILDPTGRALRVDPSQITDIPDQSFGLGKSSKIPAENMKRITEKIRQQLQIDKEDLGEYQRLVSGLLSPEEKAKKAADAATKQKATRSQSAESKARETIKPELTPEEEKAAEELREQRKAIDKKVQELQKLANVTGKMPGIDGAAKTLNMENEDEAKKLLTIVEEAGGAVIDTNADDKSISKYPQPKAGSTKFEKDSFERAKDRQKQRLEEGEEQVAAGRIFKGEAFVSKPAEILFKDFVPGQVYKKRFTLTNVSYTFNSFKMLNLSDDVTDFFVITFEKPGRMSAGVSCPIDIVFTPKVNQDIKTHIKLLSGTGPVEIPLICLIKRCAPRIQNPIVDFGTLVIGQKMQQLLHIKNTEALGTAFRVVRVESVSSNSRRPSIMSAKKDDLSVIDGDSVAEGSVAGGSVGGASIGDGSATKGSITNEAAVDASAADEEKSNIEEAEGNELLAFDDIVESDEIGSEPAVNESELSSRVRRVLTRVWRQKKKESPFALAFKTQESSIDGYGSTTMEILCAPLTLGEQVQVFSIIFAGVKDSMGTLNDLNELVTREQFVTVSVKGEEVPVYIIDDTVDMRTTLHGRIFRKRLELRNRAKSAYRVNISIPKPYNQFIEVNPPMLFVQSGGAQTVNIKFAPTPDIVTKLAHFSVPYEEFVDTALMNIPIRLDAVGQDLPVYFILKSIVTSSTVQISESVLDFGKVYMNQKSTLLITLKNLSILPQKVAFVKLKKEITIQPNDGFAALLPNESQTFEISFCPSAIMNYNIDLILLSSFNDSYTIKVIGEGIETPVTFEQSSIQMRTTGSGERVVESFIVKNMSQKQKCFEVMSPIMDFSWLRVSPAVLNLAPNQSARIEVEFCPPTDLESMDPIEWHQQVLASLQEQAGTDSQVQSIFDEWVQDSGWAFGKGMYGEIQWVKKKAIEDKPTESGEPNTDQENNEASNEMKEDKTESFNDGLPEDVPEREWGIIGNWRLPVFFFQKANSTQPPLPPFFLNVQTVVTLPQLISDNKKIDFGQMAIGTRQIKTFKIQNMGNETVALLAEGLNAVGPFTMLNPVKSLGPGESKTMVIECLPIRPGLNVEILELSNPAEIGGHRLRITFRAQGVKPSVELKGLISPPPEVTTIKGLLDFGNVVGTDVAVQKFTIINKSSFAVDANIIRTMCADLPPSRQAELVDRTSQGLPIYTYKPEKVNIPMGASQEVEVTFRPDRGRFKPFREDLNIVVGQTDEVLSVSLFGRSIVRQVYVTTGDPADEPFNKVQLSGGSQVEDLVATFSAADIRALATETRKQLAAPLPPSPPIKLEFPDPYATDVNPSTYEEVAATEAKGGKGAAAVTTPAGRKQKKRIFVNCAKVFDGRPGAGNGTFEIVLSEETKKSGLFAVSNEKGAVNAGADGVAVDFLCTLPKPRGIGGLSVGSWQTYTADVVIKGGWVPQGEPDENRIPIVLRAFVSL